MELTKVVSLAYSADLSTYFVLDCRRCDQSGPDLERHLLDGEDSRLQSLRDRCRVVLNASVFYAAIQPKAEVRFS